MQYSEQTNKILISLLDGSFVDRDYFETDVWRRLLEDKYIGYVNPRSNHVRLTDAGKAYVESLLASKADKKAQIRHDWAIAIFGTIAGGVAGLITSLIFWLITT